VTARSSRESHDSECPTLPPIVRADNLRDVWAWCG
jgi:hypothetical protein